MSFLTLTTVPIVVTPLPRSGMSLMDAPLGFAILEVFMTGYLCPDWAYDSK